MKSFNRGILLSIVVAVSLEPAPVIARMMSRYRPHSPQHLSGLLRIRKDFLQGVALESSIIAESERQGNANLNCLKTNMDIGVPAWEMKWDPMEKEGPAIWNTKGTDELANWLKGLQKGFRGHCGVWDQSTPDWVKRLDGEANKQKLKEALYKHVYEVVARYGHQMIAFDVINEPFAYDNSGNFKNDVFWRNLGYDMFVIAFEAANKAKRDTKSNVKLYINELGIEGWYGGNSRKVKAMLELIDTLRRLHVEFQGVGLQGHFTVNSFPKDLEEGIKLFTDKNLEVSITELDIRLPNNDNSQETLDRQARQYAVVYEACLKNVKCKMVVRWGVDDDHSWIPQYFPGWGRATMFGSKCQSKPKIFNAVAAVLSRY